MSNASLIGAVSSALNFCMPVPSFADTDLREGSFVRQAFHWHQQSNSFKPGAEKGEENGCWLVLNLSNTQVRLLHVSGDIKPWWSDKFIKPGGKDEWFDSDNFRERNPDAPPLTMIRKIFEPVASCHENMM